MAEDGHRTGRHARGATQKRPGAKKSKPLSKIALSAIDKNDAIVEKWLAGKTPYACFMAHIEKGYGGGVFDANVQAPGKLGGTHRVSSRGLFRSKSGAFHDPTGGGSAGIRTVLVQGGQIIGVMTDEQAARGRARARGSGSSRRSSASSLFNRGSNSSHRARMNTVRLSLEKRRRATAVSRSRSHSRSHSRSRSRSSKRSHSGSKSSSVASPEPLNWAALNATARNKMREDKIIRRKASRKAAKAAKAGAGAGAGSKTWSWF